MKKIFLTLTCLLIGGVLYAQGKVDRITSAIVEEGKLLYKSELASWFGTDIFMEEFSERSNDIGGYFSYMEGDLAKCIFFSRDVRPVVIGTISFDSTYNLKAAIADGTEREFTSNEKDIFIIRQSALEEIINDPMFKSYENTNPNLIPLIRNGEKKVFVLTGPKNHGAVILGADYLLTYDKNNKLLHKKALHTSILPIKYGEEGDSIVTIHTHLPATGDFITSTDVCTLLLYGRMANWAQHYVLSKNYVCIWDCEKEELFTLTKKAWDKIGKDQKQ